MSNVPVPVLTILPVTNREDGDFRFSFCPLKIKKNIYKSFSRNLNSKH